MGDVVAGAAGAGIGFAIGGSAGAKWGWAIGSSLGSMLSSSGDVAGPRLNDLQIIDSSYGQPIPIIYGRDRIAGNIIWSKPLEEVKNEEEQGKGGGPTTTTYNYFATFALGLCEGEITGVRRIWIDSKLIYNFSSGATAEEILASNALIDGITVYTGSESQEPDPLIQADKGAANTPAFRGLAYLLFDRLDVGNSGRIPNITVEVVTNGSTSARGFISSHRHYFEDIDTGGGEKAGALFNVRDGAYEYNLVSRVTSSQDPVSELTTWSPSLISQIDLSGNQMNLFNPNSLENSGGYSNVGAQSPQGYMYVSSSTVVERCALIDGAWVWINARTQIGSSTTGWSLMVGNIKDATGGSRYTTADIDLTPILEGAGATGDWITCAIGTFDWLHDDKFLYVFTAPSIIAGNFAADTYYKLEPSGNTYIVTETGTVSNMNNVTWPAMSFFGYGTDAGCCVDDENNLAVGYVDFPGASLRFATKSGTTISVGAKYGNYSLEGYLDASVLYKDSLAVIWATSVDEFAGMYIVSSQPVITTSGVLLSDIVSDICQRAGLSASDIDVTDLTDTVQGYTVTRPMSARNAIEPLMLAYHFDGGEYSNKLNFVKRGGTVTLTIPEEDLGVDSDDLYVQTRQQEAELPSEVILNYKDIDRDFQPGSQRSRRINTNVENVMQIDLAVALTADEAKQICEIAHYNAWVERDRFDIQVTDEYLSLNPTNVIEFVADGRTRKGRIVDVPYGPMMKLEMVAESGNYSSNAVAGESESVEQTLGIVGPTNLQLLDIPMLRNKDNEAAIYLAASGFYSAWSGCRIFKSSDDVSYAEVDALFSSVTQGYTTSVLADASSTVWDRVSTVTLRLTSGSISSTTESNALKGSNPALIGDEIVNFVNATDNGNGTYTIDTFLRGRRGTDWAADSHAIGDRFVLLEESKMGRLDVVLSTARYFKGVSIGNYLVNASSQSFINNGVSLKPFSPTFIRGTRDGSNNLTITWINRSRYIGGALQPLPLFEESRIYKVEILDALGGSVLRTLSPNPTTESDTYSAADQVTDGFTAGDPIPVRISQYSATLGAFGYTKEAIV